MGAVMAGPGKATWVKVVGKDGKTTTRAIGMTKGGGDYEKGQVITQSEFNKVSEKGAKYLSDKSSSTENKASQINPQVLAYVVKNESKETKLAKKQGMSNSESFKSVKFRQTTIHYPPTIEGRNMAAKTIQDMGQKGYPESLTKHTKNIYFSSQPNKYDAYYAEKYNQPLAVSTATGGKGDVVFYNGKPGNKTTLAHEMGHNLSQGIYGANEPPSGTKYHRAQQVEKPISEYGKVSPAEDFAESVTYYINAPDGFKRKSPVKYEAIHEILKGGDSG